MNTYEYFVELGQEYLAHYGVLGMKWGVRKNPYVAKGRALIKLKKLRSKGKIEKAKKWQSKMDKTFKGSHANKVSSKNLMKLAKADKSVRRTGLAGGALGILVRSAVSKDFRNRVVASEMSNRASKQNRIANRIVKKGMKRPDGPIDQKDINMANKALQNARFRDQNLNYMEQYLNKDRKKRKK